MAKYLKQQQRWKRNKIIMLMTSGGKDYQGVVLAD